MKKNQTIHIGIKATTYVPIDQQLLIISHNTLWKDETTAETVNFGRQRKALHGRGVDRKHLKEAPYANKGIFLALLQDESGATVLVC